MGIPALCGRVRRFVRSQPQNKYLTQCIEKLIIVVLFRRKELVGGGGLISTQQFWRTQIEDLIKSRLRSSQQQSTPDYEYKAVCDNELFLTVSMFSLLSNE